MGRLKASRGTPRARRSGPVKITTADGSVTYEEAKSPRVMGQLANTDRLTLRTLKEGVK